MLNMINTHAPLKPVAACSQLDSERRFGYPIALARRCMR